ncbi:SDR family oxidoreductase [Profundibacter sp.]
MIVVFGATGTIGAPLVTALLAKGAQVRAVTSDASKIDALKSQGCEAVVASFDDPDALAQACAGAQKAFLVTPADLDMRSWKANVIAAATKAGVKHMAISTGLGASPKAGLTFGIWHSESQELLKESGMDWTLIQPTYFIQNLLWQAGNIAANDVYLDDLGGPISWVDARDIADVAAVALTSDGHAGKAYGLTGSQAVNGDEIAALLSKATGRKIVLQHVSPTESHAGMVASGMDPAVADAMVQLSGLGPKGYLAGIETTVSDILNRPARSVADFITQNSAAFKS